MSELLSASVIADALHRVALARATSLEDDTIEVYLDALADLDATLVAQACRELAKLERREYDTALPSVGTIRERVARIGDAMAAARAAAKLLPLPASDQDGPRFLCLDCRDESNGWRHWWCPGAGDLRRQALPTAWSGTSICECGQRREHAPHPYVTRCTCWETNSVIARRREREQNTRRAVVERRKSA
jgi:hypothetical protein